LPKSAAPTEAQRGNARTVTQLTIILLATLALTIRGALASEINLRCDPVGYPPYGREPILIFVDTEKQTVHVGTSDDRGWYTNGNTYRTIEGNDRPATRDEIGWTACHIVIKQTVTISAGSIYFGEDGANINACGGHGSTGNDAIGYRDNGILDSPPGQLTRFNSATIDRNTGILNWVSQYQCRPYSGRAF
jgi:hypothetical protein